MSIVSNLDMPLVDRADATLTRAALLAVAVLAPLLLVVVPALAWVSGSRLVWTGAVGDGGRLPAQLLDDAVAQGARLTWDGTAEISVDGASTGLWLAVLVTDLLLAAAVVAVSLLLRRVVGAIRADRAFTTGSLRALRVCGVVVVVTAVLHPLADGVTTALVLREAVPGSPWSVGFTFSPLWVLAGALVLVLAEAFRAGLSLREDVDGLV